jgi:restriction endonuclease S subunit
MENLSVISRNPSVVYIGTENIDEDRIDGEFYNYKYLENEIKLKKSGVKIKVLNDVIERMNSPIGWQGIPSTSYLPHGLGVPLIRVQNVSDLILNEESLIGVEESIYDEQPAIQAQANDIIITRVGTIGRVCRIPEKINRIAMGQNLTRIKLKETLIESGFMLAFMSSKFCQIQMERYAYGGVQASLTNRNIKQLLVPIPSPEIQKYIGDKVRKAEELREEAKGLKEEAEEIINESLNFKQLDLLYKGSKVKFKWISTNVLTDRIDGNYYEQKYVETINHIKRNSKKYITLNSIIDSIYTGKKPIYDEKGTEAYFVQSGNISSNFLEIDNKEKVDLSKYNQVLFGDLLIAKDGETIGKIAINLTNEIIIINEHTYCVRLKEKYKYYSAYIYYLLINDYINPLIRREATGSAQKGLNFSFAENIIIPILEEDIIMNLYNLELRRCNNIYKSKQLILEAKQDVEDLIEGNFDMSKVKANN